MASLMLALSKLDLVHYQLETTRLDNFQILKGKFPHDMLKL